jgi:hypothetical protein
MHALVMAAAGSRVRLTNICAPPTRCKPAKLLVGRGFGGSAVHHALSSTPEFHGNVNWPCDSHSWMGVHAPSAHFTAQSVFLEHSEQFASRAYGVPSLTSVPSCSSFHTHTHNQSLSLTHTTPSFQPFSTAGQLFHVHQVRLSRRPSSLSFAGALLN